MKFLCLFAGALLAAAIVEANIRDIEHDRQTVQWNEQYNHGRLNFNDKNWYNQVRNQKYNHLTDGEYNKQHQTYEHNHQQHYGFTSDVSSGSISSDSSSQEEYTPISGNYQKDAAYMVGSTSAKNMVKFYAIVEKYINNNGQIQNRWSNEPVELQQVTVPLPNHQFLTMNENKINGLEQAIIKSIKLNTENNYFDVDYHVNDLLVNGNLKTNNGQKERFQVKMLNTDVTVSTELYNKNLKTVDAYNEKLDITLENSSLLEKQIFNDNTKSWYLRYLKRAIENQMVENAYNGLTECMRYEAQKDIVYPKESIKNMEIYNKKSGLKVALVETKNWRELGYNNANKISSVAVRPIKSGNGYRVKVNIVLAKQPTWESVINVQRGEQQNTFRNVQFQANEIVVSATMEGINLFMGGRQFHVADVDVDFNGLRFDVPNDQTLATELEQNLRQMLENNMAVVLKEQLKQEYQVYQQNPEQYSQCSRSTRSRYVL